MERKVNRFRERLAGWAGLASLLLATTGVSTAAAQDEILPDLEIAAISFNNPVEPGGLVTVEVTARNSGTTMAPGTETSQSSYMIDFVLSTDAHVPAGFASFSSSFDEDVLLAGGRISNTGDLFPDLDVAYAETGALPVDTPPGDYQLCVVIDPGNGVEELDETNNVLCQSLTVADLQPDLEIVGAAFSNQIEPGGQIDVEVIARNSGTFMAMGTETSQAAYMIDIVLSTDTDVPADFAVYNAAFEEDVLLLGGRISNTHDLEAGAEEAYVESSWLPADTPPGQYQLCLVVDPGNDVEESDETNNSYCRPLTVVESALRDVPTAVAEIEGATVPGSFSLDQNYPNPFNPSTNIRFSVPRAAAVVVRVFDALGQEQATLVDEVLRAGSYTVDYHADGLASGLYFYRIEAPGYRQTRKFTLLK